MSRRGWIGPLVAALAMALPAAARAIERINDFGSVIAIQRDGSVDVTETIDVTAENQQINHGIFRDFPTSYRTRGGGTLRVGFQLLDTALDGAPVAAKEESIGGGKRIKLGDPDILVSPGRHVYTLHYRATHELGHFDGYDELYWNVTGNGWIFPIDSAHATVRLPSPARFGNRSLYTGTEGSTAQYASVTSEQPGAISVGTVAPLGPGEGLTLALAFPKGVVAPPSAGDRFNDWFARNGPSMIALLGMWVMAAYYWLAWRRAGRDPVAGTMVPLFAPPPDMSPAAVRYMMRRRVDARSLSATLVNLGVHKQLRIDKEAGGFFSSGATTITRLDGASDDMLAPEERNYLESLIPVSGGSIALENGRHSVFQNARSAVDETLSARFEGPMLRRNWGWTIGGVALFLAVLMATGAAASWGGGGSSRMVLPIAIGGIGILFRLAPALSQFSPKTMIVGAVALGMVVLMVFAGAPLLARALAERNFWPFVPFIVGLPLVLSSWWWMPSPTVEGQKLIDQIRGFKQYLSVTEGRQFDRMHPPEETPQLFEKYLPYAIALDVENRWAKRFTAVLAAAAVGPAAASTFGWYSGPGQPWQDVDGFTHDLGGSLTSTLSSAATAPGSSSGSGGGGFSGGGGGGGGGGGW